jgi:hypothetical protein
MSGPPGDTGLKISIRHSGPPTIFQTTEDSVGTQPNVIAVSVPFEMIQRQDRAGFEGLDGDVASDFTDDGKLQQLAD